MSSEKFDPNKDFLPSDYDDSKQNINIMDASYEENPKIGMFDVTNVDYPVKTETRKSLETPTKEEEDEEPSFIYKLGKGIGEFVNKAGESLGNFKEATGSAFENIAESASDRLNDVYKDPDKRRNFLIGLEIIKESSGIQPISQAKSPLGKIATGAERGIRKSQLFDIKKTEAEAKKIKALLGPRKEYRPADEEAILDLYTKGDNSFVKRRNSARSKFDALRTRYNEIFRLTSTGKEIPTGKLESLLLPVRQLVTGTEIGNKLDNYFKDGKLNLSNLSNAEKVEFQEVLNASAKQAIVSEVKDLYPASDKDIQVLLDKVGDISTSPEALIKLISVQKAAQEAYELEGDIAKSLAFPGSGKSGDVNFEEKAKLLALKKVAEKYDKQVTDETLMELYGSTDRNPFRVSQAYYYQQLKPQIKDKRTNFEIFKQTQEENLKSEEDNLKQIQDALSGN